MLYDYIYKLYFIKFANQRIDSLWLRVGNRLIDMLLPHYFRATAKSANNRLNSDKTNKDLTYIVSLTTFPARINKVWLVIETLLRQHKKPDKIILWLYEGEFQGKESLPADLLALEKRGLQIRFCDENLLPHKKYYYSLKEHPEAHLITVDDDVFYPPNLVDKLDRFRERYPLAIICPVTRAISVQNGVVKPYSAWPYNKSSTPPLFANLNIGVGSCLYPPKSLHNDVLDMDSLKEFALSADDLWLKIMSLKAQTPIVSIANEYSRFFPAVIFKNNKRLMDTNIHEGENDYVFKRLMEKYRIPIDMLGK